MHKYNMTKDEFMSMIYVYSQSGYAMRQNDSFKADIRKYDPQLADLLQAREDAYQAVATYCTGKLEVK